MTETNDPPEKPRLSREDEFLLQEHREIWEFVRKITDERNGWLKFYWAIITASLAATGYLYKYFLSGTPLREPGKFWIIATAIFFALSIVSIAVSMALFSLRKKSVEYRNHLNRIRSCFISDRPELNGYLPTRPDRRFFGANKFGVENCILYLIAVLASLILGAFVFSLINSFILPGATLFEHGGCISIIVFLVILAAFIKMVCWRGGEYDNELDARNNARENRN